MAQALLRDVPQPKRATSGGTQMPDRLAEQSNAIGLDNALAGKNRHQRMLPIAGDAGNSNDLTAADFKRQIVQPVMRLPALNAQLTHLQDHVARTRLSVGDGDWVGTEHQLRQACL